MLVDQASTTGTDSALLKLVTTRLNAELGTDEATTFRQHCHTFSPLLSGSFHKTAAISYPLLNKVRRREGDVRCL
ncbi:hypothetical protein KIPB_016647 [Kipferlia bialata]|uniref:Uncharacterized protein n=1 Tax=Kipferlia bialata TaxID=797122 RepID=A0A391NVT2_9EUKA|nr:hypothetical protein KIPB_016647 [Kipferlia bialata]|eukprot:g16647.t1